MTVVPDIRDRTFVLGACANELGFEVTGHHQPSLVAFQDYKPQSIPLDLTADQCALLVRFVAHLPRPIVQPSTAPDVVLRGRRVFDSIGCAACHAPTLGSIDGLYSDLLLHDLGDRVRGSGGGYGGQAASRIIDRSETPSDKAPKPTGEATPNEWRTTPLWGVADSAPYLHDGRAPTLEEAVRLHGGEAEKTTERFTRLSQFDRQSILAFLHSLRAPRSAARGDATRLAKGR